MDKRSLEYLAHRFREAEARTKALRQELAAAIAEADKDGILQKDICEATGYTRQQVRRIVQAESEGKEAAEPSEQIPADPTASKTRTQVE